MLIYALIFTSSFILLSDLTIPLSYPILTPISNGSSGLGDFGGTEPTFSLPAFHFSNYVQDTSQVFGVAPICLDDGCVSYFLPGGLNWINNSLAILSQGIEGLNNVSLGMGAGNLGVVSGIAGLLGAGSGGDTSGLAGLLGSGGDTSGLAGLLGGSGGDDSGLSGLLGLLGGSGDTSSLAGLLGGSGSGNDSSDGLGGLEGLLDGNSSDTSLAGLLGGNSSDTSDLLGGLKKRQPEKRQGSLSASPLGNAQNIASQLLANAPNWTAYNTNQSQAHNVPDSELAYVTYNALGYHLDFTPFTGAWPAHNRNCSTFSTTALFNISLTMCVATQDEGVNASTVVGGLRVCDPDLGIFGPKCDPNSGPDESPMQYTTQLHIQRSRATTACALRNATIISVQNEGPLIDYPVHLPWFFAAFVGPLEQSAIITLLLSSGDNSASSSVTSQLTLSLAADFMYAGMGPLDGNHQVRNLMASALSSGCLIQDNVANSGAQAVTKLVYTVHIAPATLYAFLILGTVILLWCLPVLVWSNLRCTANASGFPEVDFATKWAGSTMVGLSNADSSGVVRRLGGGTNVFVGEGGGEGEGDGKGAIVLDTAPVAHLRRGVEYF
jgi:hypothetical protein